MKNAEGEKSFTILSDKFALDIPLLDTEGHLAFHVGVRPDEAASITLILNEIEELKLVVAESFMFDDSDCDGKVLSGEDAVKTFIEQRKARIIKEFIKEQKLIHYLIKNTIGNC